MWAPTWFQSGHCNLTVYYVLVIKEGLYYKGQCMVWCWSTITSSTDSLLEVESYALLDFPNWVIILWVLWDDCLSNVYVDSIFLKMWFFLYISLTLKIDESFFDFAPCCHCVIILTPYFYDHHNLSLPGGHMLKELCKNRGISNFNGII